MCNLNTFGQLLRIIFGLLLVALAWFGPQTSIISPEWMKLWLLGWFGLVSLISGLLAFCPLYAVFGFDHHKQKT